MCIRDRVLVNGESGVLCAIAGSATNAKAADSRVLRNRVFMGVLKKSWKVMGR